MDPAEVQENIKAGNDYLSALNILEQNVNSAKEQILQSSEETEKNIKKSFADIIEILQQTLKKRQDYLLNEINQIKERSLKPLNDCKSVIKEKVDKTKEFVCFGKDLIKNSHDKDILKFNNNATILGSLPEVPQLKEVPCLSYNVDVDICKDLVNICSNFGMLLSIAPVQISSVVEKPGSILVEWDCVETDDKFTDVQEFRLQHATGTLAENKNLTFIDCYKGSECQCLIRDLRVNEYYSFRVCCKYEGSTSWTPWSIPQVGKTTIKPYCWDCDGTFTFYDGNTIIKSNNDDGKLVFSDSAQFHVGCSIEFTFLDSDANLNGTYVGLSLSNKYGNFEELKEEGFVVETNGEIYVNGAKKSTTLPELKAGSKICFSCDVINENKILISVICSEKQVTYDWFLSSEDKMYFFAKFNSEKWKLLVE